MRLALLCLLLTFSAVARAQPADPGQLCLAAITRAEAERGIPARLLLAMGRVESGRSDPATGNRQPWPWTVNAEGRGSFYPDRAAAIAAVQSLQARGVRSIDVGCLQVNLRHHPNAFASLEEAFDPLANARYAAGFLAELQAGAGDWMRAAGHYHSQTPAFAEPYRARVAAAWAEEPSSSPAAAPAFAALAPTPGGGAKIDNGADRAALLPAQAGAGRGLDAYRAAPIPLAGRTSLMARRS
jgi:hypothetical protein